MLARLLLTLALLFASFAPALAAESTNTVTIADIDSTVIVTMDGKTLEDTRLHRGDDGEIYVDAMPIFATLGNDVSYDGETKALIVRRSQDGVVMELHTETGVVSANGKALGALPVFGTVTEDDYILTPNAIAVLSGALGEYDSENNRIDFELDARLRVATGFDLWVDGRALGAVSPEPQSIGPILLLPLRPIAEELGHRVTLEDGGNTVRVERAHDSAVFTLDLGTGVVSLFGTPIGLSEDATYIDRDRLLLPVGVFESLTGTAVQAGEGGRIEIDIDDRLGDAIAPRGSIEDVARETPFEIEYAEFSLSPQQVNRITVGAHAGAFDGRARVELSDLPTRAVELTPDWVSMDFRHISGLQGSVGDVNASRRELVGVGAQRIRGVSLHGERDGGKWAFAAGTPAAGRVAISEDQSRYSFKGLVAGGSWQDDDGWEASLAARHDPDTADTTAILSAISGRLGRKRDAKTEWNVTGAVGAFVGPSRGRPVDVRVAGTLRHTLSDSVRLNVGASYDGVEFTRSVLRKEDIERMNALLDGRDGDIAEDDPADIRQVELDNASLSASVSAFATRPVGPLDGPGISLGASASRAGVFGSEGATSLSASVSIGSRIRGIDVDVSAGASRFETTLGSRNNADTETLGPLSGTTAFATAYKDFGIGTLRARVDHQDFDGQPVRTTTVVSASARAARLNLPKGANLAVAPSANAVFAGGVTSLRGGVTATLDSGDVLGRKNRVNASFVVAQSTNSRTGMKTQSFLNVTAARQVRIGRNMEVGLGYRADMQGRHDLRLILNGRYDFNARSRLRLAKDGAGLLQGQAFVDLNNDGVRQPNEKGAGGIVVRLQGTPYALRSDPGGSYAVHNVKRGLYAVTVDNRSLPLGYGLMPSAKSSVTIRPGHVTVLDLPIQRFGQIRGKVYRDADASGAFERGEARPEGLTLELRDADGDTVTKTATTAFGQFAFDSLPVGTYTIHYTSRTGDDGAGPLTVDLAEAKQAMARVSIGIRERSPVDAVRSVEADAAPDTVPGDPPPPQSTGLPPPP